MPRQPRTKRLSDILSHEQTIRRSGALRTLFSGAASRESIHTRFEECLPDQLKGQFIVAGLQQGLLTLHCASAALATRFRFEEDRILKALQMRIGQSQVAAIKVQIRPNSVPKPATKTGKVTKKRAAGNQTIDERLEGVLERLGRRSDENKVTLQVPVSYRR
ncbi:hypothetical protein A3765_01575 [Oleiphilus sp. HI0130]|uniref:DUF721 domain-containing protein n=1 Tax=Oleiphilus sp. HI0079 TaxID=1822254 RepID=UPI0007C2B15F|nr:DUF721 domain-containing protein [Oleiphilus sp. HI0079]KZZ15057.1 hypothetical protein A3750_01440 [Oleiphilus sp. HI0079]KZZ74407.1 hypothetical protein A3765_01575 [Oleiphilus sp. HI0130]